MSNPTTTKLMNKLKACQSIRFRIWLFPILCLARFDLLLITTPPSIIANQLLWPDIVIFNEINAWIVLLQDIL